MEEDYWDLLEHWEMWIARALSRSFLPLVEENDIKATISHPGEFEAQEPPSFGLGLTLVHGFLGRGWKCQLFGATPFLGAR